MVQRGYAVADVVKIFSCLGPENPPVASCMATDEVESGRLESGEENGVGDAAAAAAGAEAAARVGAGGDAAAAAAVAANN